MVWLVENIQKLYIYYIKIIIYYRGGSNCLLRGGFNNIILGKPIIFQGVQSPGGPPPTLHSESAHDMAANDWHIILAAFSKKTR